MTDAELDAFSANVLTKARMMAALLDRPWEIYTRDPNTVEVVPPARTLVVAGHEVTVQVVTGLRDKESEARGLPPCHVGIEVDYRGEAKIVEGLAFDSVPSWHMIGNEVDVWIAREDPWSWREKSATE